MDYGYSMVPVDEQCGEYCHRMGRVPFDNAPMCQVCRIPFKTYVYLDHNDPRLNIDISIPILYCHDCETVNDWFFYQIRGTGPVVIKQYLGEKLMGWPQPHGLRGMRLEVIPTKLGSIAARLNRGYYSGANGLSAADDTYLDKEVMSKPFHQFGGYPVWIQEPVCPLCPVCAERMRFLLFLSSDASIGWQCGDWGILYYYLCSRCRTVGSILQCT